MNIRHDRRNARPVRFILPNDARHEPRPADPADRLLDPQLNRVPTVAELAWLVGERAAQIYPGVPREAIDRAAHQSAEKVLSATSPSAAAFLPELALREASGVIRLYMALAGQNHLRLVA